ncbi:MAG: hypothetical protein D3908_13660, partial [Candidatus Electrothrix sp. AUS4]|nr:hypothetical protein [Candidatus Electrothrix sp. AUS4]
MMQQAFDLKGASFTIPMLSLRESNIRQISAQLAEKVCKAPSFFHNAPLVLNLGMLPDPERIDITELLALVRKQGFLPVGISNCTEEQQKQAGILKLPVLSTRGSGRAQEEKSEEEEIQPEAEAKPDSPQGAVFPAATVISDPIRS